VLIGILVSR